MITTTTTTATSQIGDLNEIPNLKPPRETFVDQPKSPEDVNLEELIYDLQNGTKTSITCIYTIQYLFYPKHYNLLLNYRNILICIMNLDGNN